MVTSIRHAKESVTKQRGSFRADEFVSNRSRQRSNGIDTVSLRTNSQSTTHSSVSDDDSFTVMSGVPFNGMHHQTHLQLAPAVVHDVRQATQLSSIPPDVLEPMPNTLLSSPLLPTSVMSTSPSMSQHSQDGFRRAHVPPPSSTTSDDSLTTEVRKQLLELGNNRGTGSHYCPWGTACSKGGLDKDGKVIQFTRNSAYKSVNFMSLFSFSPYLPLHKFLPRI
jgi:hypothetical protein